MDTANFGTTLVTWLSAAGIKILIALATLLVAFKIINTIAKRLTPRTQNQENSIRPHRKPLPTF